MASQTEKEAFVWEDGTCRERSWWCKSEKSSRRVRKNGQTMT